MRLLSTFTLTSILTLSLATAQTTMCFKENHKNMATIESTNLDGGECAGKKSLNEMKKEGWEVADINITSSENSKSYVYILKKDETKTSSSIDEAALEQKILQRLEERKKKEVQIKKERIFAQKSKSGEALYKNKCVTCHGKKGEIKAKGVSRPLNTLNYDDFTISIRDYMNGTYDRGMAFVMKPYATSLTGSDIKNVYVYIKSINQDKKMKKKEEAKN